jgi:hypothetical protein
LWYPALDNPESSVNQKLTKRPITFYYSINWQHLVPIPRVRSLIIDVLFVFFLDYIYVCDASSYEKGIESAAGKTGQDSDKLNS